MAQPTTRRVIVLVACVCIASANLYTDYSARKSKAAEMLHNLYSAARNRADRLRRAEGKDPAEAVPSSTDMFARLLDYSSDKLKNPPLKSVEQNLVVLRQAIAAIAEAVAPIVQSYNEECHLEGPDTVCGQDNAGQKLVANVTRTLEGLVPVQGERYTLL